MDKEQLMWRLTQTDVSTFGPAEDFFHDSSNNEFQLYQCVCILTACRLGLD